VIVWKILDARRKNMPKSIAAYWNPLSLDHHKKWNPIPGLEGVAEELTLSLDKDSGEYTRLTRFHAGADTTAIGGKSHNYPEEVFIVSGRLYDQAFDLWLTRGHYASRPPGEIHGPFKTDIGCVVLEVSFPNRIQSENNLSG
jgi:ChrR Cupin-like domain